MDCTAWRHLAENLAASGGKGARLVVTGRLRTERWETPEGEKRSKMVMDADEVGASMLFATVTIARTTHDTPPRSTAPDAPWTSASPTRPEPPAAPDRQTRPSEPLKASSPSRRSAEPRRSVSVTGEKWVRTTIQAPPTVCYPFQPRHHQGNPRDRAGARACHRSRRPIGARLLAYLAQTVPGRRLMLPRMPAPARR
ncbi:single-stranded DNA-binding protein [Streptomyces vinaceus]|uniref:single-stranded DNA-binding protein n=1 Tax=Streptomyces vinaceus TaxID=1960 RepID=UPI0035E05507